MMNWSRKAGVKRKRRRELIFPLFPRWQNHKCTVLSLVCPCSYKKCGVIGKLHASPAPLNVFKQTTIIGRCFRLFCPNPHPTVQATQLAKTKMGVGISLERSLRCIKFLFAVFKSSNIDYEDPQFIPSSGTNLSFKSFIGKQHYKKLS